MVLERFHLARWWTLRCCAAAGRQRSELGGNGGRGKSSRVHGCQWTKRNDVLGGDKGRTRA
jgi:hypothetical protein